MTRKEIQKEIKEQEKKLGTFGIKEINKLFRNYSTRAKALRENFITYFSIDTIICLRFVRQIQ